ncbi:MAG: FHA domain-containing protein [Labilithrix sp.]|nr:FHA domain-containing protein [Labilithrix sp.]
MITCPKCTKDNQDHYKFCLGCGAELPRDAAPKPFTPQTPPQGVKAVGAPSTPTAAPGAGAPLVQPQPQPTAAPPPQAAPSAAPPHAASQSQAPAGATVTCPQCGHINAPSNLFCGSCGFRLGGAAAPPKAAPQPSASVAPGNVVLTALRADGSEAGTYALPGGTVTVGRETGSIFAGDSYLSPRHATFKQAPGRLTVKDEASLNGVYKKLVRDVPVELHPNDMFRIGQEIIKFEPLASQPVGSDGVERLGSPAKGYVGRIALVIGRDVTGNAFPIPESGVHLGRERGDVLFPEDGYVSGLHCRLSWEGGRLMLTDLGSSNGSFLRLREETDIKSGDVLLMGQQLFRVAV